ncbi:MAG: Cof-type HAD-IIB family hydrolase [Rikenellaceae bacterium]|nr:Cof-type HAD-IIB family hydrolase [Rikenellaceae bacterium]
MLEKLILRLTCEGDLPEVMRIIADAQADFRARGIDQWQNGYPNEAAIRCDIARGESYVVIRGEQIVATAMITFAPDPNYAVIYGGEWLLAAPKSYATIHRIAVDLGERGQGIAEWIVGQTERMCRKRGADSLRIDTHRDNRSMQRVAEKNGMTLCGIIHLADGAERLAYEKIMNNRPNIRAVFFDIDGTLVSFNTHRVSDATVEALAELRRRGVKVILATGRLLNQTEVVSRIKFDAYITLNGCCCLAEDGTTVISKATIPQSDLEAIVDFLEENNHPFPCSFMDEQGSTINYVDDRVQTVWDNIALPAPRVEDPRQTIKRNIYQANIYVDEVDEGPIVERYLQHCESTRWHPLFADVNLRGVSKQQGVDTMLAYFGISREEAMAFGDGGNDVSMLGHVGWGVAMGNAVDTAKQAAVYVTDTVDDEGICKALQHFGLID